MEKPTVYGVGYSFKGAYSKYNRLYRVWARMLERCYGENDKRIMKYYRDIFVCDRWLYFSNFLEDAQKLEGYNDFKRNPKKYSLDKDIKGNGRLYSKENCIFTDAYEQMTKATGKKIIVIHPDGIEEHYRSANEACRHLNLIPQNISKFFKGEVSNVNGYKFKRP